MKALILAAGEGTRLRPLTFDCPKPMLPIAGRPLLEHLVELLRSHGITDIVINLHYRPETIVDHFGSGKRLSVSITYSYEPSLAGTAGAAKRLEWFFTEPFVVLYGDVLTNLDLGELIRWHGLKGGVATLALYVPEDLTRCGVAELDADSRVVNFVEKPAEPAPGGLAAAGVCVFEPDVLRHIPAGVVTDFGADTIPHLIRDGLPVYGRLAGGYLLDIGSPERYAQAKAEWRSTISADSLRLGPELRSTISAEALEVRPTSRFLAQVAVGRTSCDSLRLGPVLQEGFSAEALGAC